MSDVTYVSCPGGCGALLTEEYKSRFGQCMACYERENTPLDIRISRSLRRA